MIRMTLPFRLRIVLTLLPLLVLLGMLGGTAIFGAMGVFTDESPPCFRHGGACFLYPMLNCRGQRIPAVTKVIARGDKQE